MRVQSEKFHVMLGHVEDGCEIVSPAGKVFTLKNTIHGWRVLGRNERVWGHFDCNDYFHGRHVGPWYKTKAEVLADHESYLVRAGWLKLEGI
jgi:hypothetical protein